MIIAALPSFSIWEPLSVPSFFFSSPHGNPCLIVCRLFTIFITIFKQCKKKTKNIHARCDEVTKSDKREIMNVTWKMQYRTPVEPALKRH